LGYGDPIPVKSMDKFVQQQPWELQFGVDGKLYFGLSAVGENSWQTYFLAGLRLIQYDMDKRKGKDLGMLYRDDMTGFLFECRFKADNGKLGWVDAGYFDLAARVIIFDPKRLEEHSTPLETMASMQDHQQKFLEDNQVDINVKYGNHKINSKDISRIGVYGAEFDRGSCAVTTMLATDKILWGGTSGNQAGLFRWERGGKKRDVQKVHTWQDQTDLVQLFKHNDKILGVASNTSNGGVLFSVDCDDKISELAKFDAEGGIIAVTGCGQTIYLLSRKGKLLGFDPVSSKFEELTKIEGKDFSPVLAVLGLKVMGAGDYGQIFAWDTEAKQLEQNEYYIPASRGSQYCAQWTAAAQVGDAIIGGTSEGFLFRLESDGKTIRNLGKTLHCMNVACLTVNPDGWIYGAGGRSDELGHVFRYHPEKGFEDLGIIHDIPDGHLWTSLVIGSMASVDDGTVFIGEKEDISHAWKCRFSS
jgi:hypothetical protein